ncbi:hypothetical protein [Aureimonas flava]|nr:hypothetical protein [Aureimonas flava]
MNRPKGPLGAAQGITLGCLLSGAIWLAGLNVLLLSQGIRF